MKKFLGLFLILTILMTTACSSDNKDKIKEVNTEEVNKKETSEKEVEEKVSRAVAKGEAVVVTDSNGSTFEIGVNPQNVVVLGSTITDVWLMSGGNLIGTSSDSFKLGLNNVDIQDVGNYNAPDLEKIIALNPNLVIMSKYVIEQSALEEPLKEAGINVFYADINAYDEYLTTLKSFTDINKNPDAYEEYGNKVDSVVNEYIALANEKDRTDALVLKSSKHILVPLDFDNFAAKILKDMGIDNIADKSDDIFKDLDIDAIVKEDPYYIFVVVAGNNEEEGMIKMNEYIASNPKWNELTAVKEGRYNVLPSDLFYNKPNERWAEAYRYIYDIREKNE